jgi:hypothetical protein
LTATGCSLPGATAAPAEPFGDFVVGEFGGIDGRQNLLHVRADGVALLISRAPAAGQLNDPDLNRLRTLLTSEQFRKEVSEAQRNPPTPQQVCSDQITTKVTMSKLSISRTEPCGAASEPTPAFDEIVSSVAPAMSGNFDRPVDTTKPRLFPVRLERLQVQDQPAYTIKIDGAGRGMITISGRKSELHSCRSSSATPFGCSLPESLRCRLSPVGRRPITGCASTQSRRCQAPIAGFRSGSRNSVR